MEWSKIKIIKSLFTTLIIFAVISYLIYIPVFAREVEISSDIVLVADTSGSMQQSDNNNFLKDALKLGVDLAPYNSQISLVTLSNKIVTQTELIDSGNEANRSFLKKTIEQISYTGNTNFGVGISGALDILDSSISSDKRIILLGDYFEGGYTQVSSFESESKKITDLAKKAKDNNIKIDLVLIRNPENKNEASENILKLPSLTGGKLILLSNSSDFPKSIEDIYFSAYKYLKTTINVDSTKEGRIIDLSMPTEYVNKAKIYVPTIQIDTDIKASYAGATLNGEFNRSYSMINLDRPSREGVSLSIVSDELDAMSVHIIADYAAYLNVSATHEMVKLKGEKNPKQVTTLLTEVCDKISGKSIFVEGIPNTFKYDIELFDSNGEKINLVKSLDKPFKYIFDPLSYGDYTVNTDLLINDVNIQIEPQKFKIDDIRPVKKSWNLPIILASVIGIALILLAILFARQHRRKELYEIAAQTDADYRFYGKLYICAVLVDGGARDISPFNFYLNKLRSEKRINLAQIFQSNRILHSFKDTENILFLVGPSQSIIVRNNSKSKIRIAGKEYGYKEKFQLFFGQKMYIIFEENENEIEVYYRDSKEDFEPTTKLRVSLS